MKRKKFTGKTIAYLRFDATVWKIESMLKLGIVGIHSAMDDEFKDLISKVKVVKGIPGPKPKKYNHRIEVLKREVDRTLFFFDKRSAFFLKKVIMQDKKRHEELIFFLYSNIFVNTWSAFETYSQMLFEEILTNNPNMLKCNEQISIQDIISNKENMIEYLVERQVEKIGHFKIEELLAYYNKTINFTIIKERLDRIKNYYFIRNIISHKSGIVRKSQHSKIPSGIKVVDEEIQISKTFLLKSVKDIKSLVKDIEKKIEAKFYK